MVRKLSLGSRRRWSKANNDGSLSANMAKPDIRASRSGIKASWLRGSFIRSKRSRKSRNRESAERCLRAFLADMVSNSFCLSYKMGKPGRYFVNWHYEREVRNQRLFQRKTCQRELLLPSKCSQQLLVPRAANKSGFTGILPHQCYVSLGSHVAFGESLKLG